MLTWLLLPFGYNDAIVNTSVQISVQISAFIYFYFLAYTQEWNCCIIYSSVLCLVVQSCPTLCNHMDCSPPGSSVHGDSPGKNTGVGCHALLQVIFLTQRSNPDLPHCRAESLLTEPLGSPRILEWVAYPFCMVSSWSRNRPTVSCIAGGFFTSWATREAPYRVVRLNFLRNKAVYFQSNCSILYSHQQCIKSSNFSTSLSPVAMFSFLFW